MALTDDELKKINPKKNLQKRPTWTEYYMSLAFLVSLRSFDPSSKCGCVIISSDNRILSTGYNGPIKGSNDEKIPLTRPDRYDFMIHAEENALLSYSGSYQDIQNAAAYVTTRPCSKCLRGLLQKGITKLVYSMNKTIVVSDKDISNQELMLSDRNIQIIKIPIEKYKNILQKINVAIITQ